MHRLGYLIPGLPQFLRGQRLVGLVLGASLIWVVLYLYWANRQLLLLHRELRERAPRSAFVELIEEKEAQKRRGAGFALALLILSGLDAAFGPRGSAGAASESDGGGP